MRPVKFMTTVMMLATLQLIAFPAIARSAGTESGGGGGDPDVVEFLKYAQKFSVDLKSNGYHDVHITPQRLDSRLNAIIGSLEQTSKAKLRFTTNTILDANGVEKAAFFNRKDGSILVQRTYWRGSTVEERRTLVVIELSGLSGSETRYEDALNVSAIQKRELAKNKVKLCGFYVLPRNITRSRIPMSNETNNFCKYVSDGTCGLAQHIELLGLGGGMTNVVCQEGGVVVLLSLVGDPGSSEVEASVWPWIESSK